ncbi:MAG TPA: S9 family peptidase [Longimicrobiales bacterium]
MMFPVRLRQRAAGSWLLLCALSLPLPLAAQTHAGTTDGWTPALSMRYRTIQGTAVSPDGERVAYVVREPVMEGDQSEWRSQIWLVAADGSRNVQYTRGEESASSPSFSPDGRLLAFTSSRSGERQVWILPVDGGEAWQLTDAESGVSSFRWSPDGARIAYTMRDPETEAEKKAKEEKRYVIVVDQDFKYNHLYVVDLEPDTAGEREARRLTEGAFHVTSFDWSPDGRSIIFARQPDPRLDTGYRYGDIAVVSVEGGAPKPLVTWDGVDGDPLYSPDGRWIAFVSTGERPEPVGLGDVYVVPAEGGAPRRLAETPDRNARLIGWSADGESVYVTEPVGTTRQVLAVPLDGSPVHAVTEGEGVFGSVSIAADGSRMAFTFETPATPADVYISPVADFSMTRLTDVNRDIPRPPMGRTELVHWTSKDGTPVEGLLTYPVGYREGQRVPLILNVHGGPAGVFTQSFTGGPSIYMLQYFAQEGFAVLRPNPRGSTGYGKEFRYANVEDWGYGDFEDLMSGVDHVIAMGVAHPDSLLLMGWSYGGYMTSFAVTRTDRFKAASMGAGLPDLISMVTTTDIGRYLEAHMGGPFWEDYETYQKHSAIYHIEDVHTPTQVIHGAEDLRVPFTQGQEFYRALRRLGVPTEMIVLPRTPHGPREPKLLMEVSPRILAWFTKHLRGGGVAVN